MDIDLEKNIISIRNQKKLRPSDMAKSLNIPQGNYSRLEKKGNNLTFKQLQQIAEALGVSLYDIINGGEIFSPDDFVKSVTELQNQLYEKTDFLQIIKKNLNYAEGHINALQLAVVQLLEQLHIKIQEYQREVNNKTSYEESLRKLFAIDPVKNIFLQELLDSPHLPISTWVKNWEDFKSSE